MEVVWKVITGREYFNHYTGSLGDTVSQLVGQQGIS